MYLPVEGQSVAQRRCSKKWLRINRILLHPLFAKLTVSNNKTTNCLDRKGTASVKSRTQRDPKCRRLSNRAKTQVSQLRWLDPQANQFPVLVCLNQASSKGEQRQVYLLCWKLKEKTNKYINQLVAMR